MSSKLSDFTSPLRYPGGKGKFVGFFKELIKTNKLYDCIYVEPYAGGASVGLSLLFSEYVSEIQINDIDPAIYAFWDAVLNDTDRLCMKIQDTAVSVDEWDRQRSIQKDQSNHTRLDIAYSTFFMNRANRSGIITAGIIGGRSQQGNWKIDARFNKHDLLRRITRIAEYRDLIRLTNLDAEKLIQDNVANLPEKTLCYLDPPYYEKGQALYLNAYTPKDHKRIAKLVGDISKQRWVVTYDNISAIQEFYSDFKQEYFTLNYSATSPKTGKEVMILSDNLVMPRAPIVSPKVSKK